MEWELRTPSLSRNSWIHDVLENQEQKIRYYQNFQTRFFKKEKDLLKGIESKAWVIVCDERGQAPSSQGFATELGKILESGKNKAYFLIGGPYGLSQEVMTRADSLVSLSHFVLNQEVALAVLSEQIFRALTILNNHPYHNE